jgi:hypothetical protein
MGNTAMSCKSHNLSEHCATALYGASSEGCFHLEKREYAGKAILIILEICNEKNMPIILALDRCYRS